MCLRHFLSQVATVFYPFGKAAAVATTKCNTAILTLNTAMDNNGRRHSENNKPIVYTVGTISTSLRLGSIYNAKII